VNDLSERLQAALGQAYQVERELGGGGMSRVFLALEVGLRRQVVIKVLPPEMSAGVNAERFRREIQLAASLQHPHIVPLLTAGSAGDLLYYVMPHIPGESLREKLAREGELPVNEALRVLRDVLDALAEAHAKGVVHRDIKPDNILLSGKHAVVTDFGVAKAVSESVKGSSITSFGVALGTPAYMAPEQAAADPHVDHRADIYAVGALAYEMLCGRPPFVASTPQAVLAAQVTQAPEPCTAHRPTVSPALNALVMRCLEKKAADRPQTAGDLLALVETMTTPSGGMTPTDATAISSGTRAAIERHHPVRVVVLSIIGALASLAAIYGAVRLIGLPGWVTPAALALVAVGVPVVVFTGRQERRRLIAKSTGAIHPTPAGLRRYFTWKRTLVTGGVAFAGLAVLTAAYMAMRVLGIGPIGTLMGKGLLHARDTVLVADFENRTSDSTLGHTVTELIRLDLEQSRAVSLFQPEAVRDALARMRRPATTPLSNDVALELARRESLKAIVTGEVSSVGGEFVVSARLVGAASGNVLVARRETARSQQELLDAVDRLSAGLRERIGESLRSIQSGLPMVSATTSSFPALQAYLQASRANAVGQIQRALTLLRQAVALDTTFAEAYRKLGIIFANNGFPRDSTVHAFTRAHALRSRLPDTERLLVEAGYHFYVTQNWDSAMVAYRGVLDRRPDHSIALQNLAYAYRASRHYLEAESLYAVLCATVGRWGCSQLAINLEHEGKFDDAQRVLDRWEATRAYLTYLPRSRALLALARGEYDVAERIAREQDTRSRARGLEGIAGAEWALMQFAGLHGHEREGERHRLAWSRADRTINPAWWPEQLALAWWTLWDAAWLGRDTRQARAAVVDAFRRYPLADHTPSDRDYPSRVFLFAWVGDTATALEALRRYQAEVTDVGPRTRRQDLRWMYGNVALARERWQEGIDSLAQWEHDTADPLNIFYVAWAYDRAGKTDSAVALYSRFLEIPTATTANWLPIFPLALRRLGELHEARGDRAKARDCYLRFAELWKNADLELQPFVREARAKAERLKRG
jgi:tetratricopeptide (TPR) repeat protein